MTQNALPLPIAQAAAASTPFLVLASLLSNPEAANVAEAEIRAQVRRQGRKFTKVEAIYAPFTPIPPAAFRYECQTCRFWQAAGRDGPFPTCATVGLQTDPFGGRAIHPLAWCGFWLQPRGEPALRWLAEFLDPSLPPVRGSL